MSSLVVFERLYVNNSRRIVSTAQAAWCRSGYKGRLALFGILGAVILMLIPDNAYEVLALGISITLVYYGVKYIIFYLTNAQHMVISAFRKTAIVYVQ